MLGAIAPLLVLFTAAVAAAAVPAVVMLVATAAGTAGAKSKPGSRAVASIDVASKQTSGESHMPVGVSLLHPCSSIRRHQ